jgi:hypothetical protein
MPLQPLPIPDEFYTRAFNIGRAAIPLNTRADQKEAQVQLLAVLDADRANDLPEALRQLCLTRRIDINGRKIPASKVWTARAARQLADEVETWIDDQRHGRIA